MLATKNTKTIKVDGAYFSSLVKYFALMTDVSMVGSVL